LGYEFDTPTSNILNEEERKTTNDDFICYFRRFPKLYFGGRTGQSPLFLDGQQVKKLHREFPTRKTKVKKTKVKKTKVKRIKHFVQCSVFMTQLGLKHGLEHSFEQTALLSVATEASSTASSMASSTASSERLDKAWPQRLQARPRAWPCARLRAWP
jgi:hypothetical protein